MKKSSIVLLSYLNSIALVLIFYCILNGYKSSGQSVLPMSYGFNNHVYALTYDSVTDYLYASGLFTTLATPGGAIVNHIAKWDGNQWSNVGTGANNFIGSTALYNGNLIVGGYFTSIGGINAQGLARWDGATWNFLGNATSQNNGCVLSLFVGGSDLYVGGCFDSINGMPAQGIARFDGVNWYTYPSLNSTFHFIAAIIVFNNELYIGGNFSSGSGKQDIMKFDGSNWVTVGGGLSGANTHISHFIEYQNKLYVMGYFDISFGDPGNNIAIWDGISWSQPDNGVVGSNVLDAHIFNNELYFCGQIGYAGSIPVSNIAAWDGNSWSGFHGITFNNGVGALSSKGNKLFMGGGFHIVDGDTIYFVAQYDESTGLMEPLSSCINVSMNESNEIITITSQCKDIKLYFKVSNVLGQELKSGVMHSDQTINLNFDGMSSGLMIFNIYSENGKYYKKFIRL